jgi:hypothetical protein
MHIPQTAPFRMRGATIPVGQYLFVIEDSRSHLDTTAP